ncbi:MAG: uroporphyrinogen-III synthase, partial [Gammaproteobacteria bacterium]|nr:uroporphyrinogen-III synthase [Gammaproteobacteria bacterium]
MNGSALQDRLIALPEMRELDLFASLLERRGARVLRAPLVAIRDAPDPQPVLGWLRDFCSGDWQELVLLTGEGLRRLLACLERHEPGLRPAFLAALRRTRKITRGPKPERALHALGLAADLQAGTPTTAGVIATLATLALRGHTVGVQLYGSDPNEPLQQYLRDAGALVRCVAPYVYADAAADSAVRELLARLAGGEVDAIAFTSKAQVARLFEVADAAAVLAALAATQVAAVG